MIPNALQILGFLLALSMIGRLALAGIPREERRLANGLFGAIFGGTFLFLFFFLFGGGIALFFRPIPGPGADGFLALFPLYAVGTGVLAEAIAQLVRARLRIVRIDALRCFLSLFVAGASMIGLCLFANSFFKS